MRRAGLEMTPLTDAWFAPRSLVCYEARARPLTAWRFVELRDDSGLVGLAEITYGQEQEKVVSALARMTGRLRGARLRSDGDFPAKLGLIASDLEKDIVLATAVSGTRSALADALARRAALPLADFLMLGGAKAHGGQPTSNGETGAARDRGPVAVPLRASGTAAGTPARRVELYANINRALLPQLREKAGMPPRPSDRSPDGLPRCRNVRCKRVSRL